MGQSVRKSKEAMDVGRRNVDGYKPKLVPNALRAIESDAIRDPRGENENMQETKGIQIVDVAPFKALAVRVEMTPDKSGTRIAWSKLSEKVPLGDARIMDGPSVFVFIPQHQWGNKVDTLWVGIAVREFGDVPEGVEALELPGGPCASARVEGDESHMWGVYDEMFGWLDQSSEYELDRRPGVLGMETVPFEPFNSLTVPYSELETFHFTMLYPVRKKA